MKASLCRARETRKAERGTPIAARHDVANRSGNTGAEDGGETELQEGQRKTKAERTKKKRRRRKKRRPPITSRYRRSLKTQKTENQPHYFYLPPSLRLSLLHAPISRNSPWSLVPVHALTRSHPSLFVPRCISRLSSSILSSFISFTQPPRASSTVFGQIVVRNRRISGPQAFSLFRHEGGRKGARPEGTETTESTNRRLRISTRSTKSPSKLEEGCYRRKTLHSNRGEKEEESGGRRGRALRWQDSFLPNREGRSNCLKSEDSRKKRSGAEVEWVPFHIGAPDGSPRT